MSQVKLFKCIPIPSGSIHDAWEHQSIHMAVAHNMIIRSYNSMLYYSGAVEPGTKRFSAFLAYCELAVYSLATAQNGMLHNHHQMEEQLYFPFLESKLGQGAMSHNVTEHEHFHDGLIQFENLVASLKSGKAQWNVNEFRAAIYAFATPLIEHLAEEIDTIRPERLRGKITQEEFAEHDKVFDEHIKKILKPTIHPPFTFVNGDATNAPWHLLYHVNSDMWQFGCCDKYMKVKPEFAAYEPTLEATRA
ncbi:hypothetical protein FRB99_001163 [Tulasnella sp. 403]|nr:hypothetical protein FRB99_001163 [Tulasnella sp. 403]